jgi:hypothetical protein
VREDPLPARALRHDRFLIQFTVGSLPHEQTLKAIELIRAAKVAPIVREEVSRAALLLLPPAVQLRRLELRLRRAAARAADPAPRASARPRRRDRARL